MAKNKRRRDNNSSIASQRLPVDNIILRPIEDRRQFHPLLEQAPARSFKKSQHTLTAPRRRRSAAKPAKIPQPHAVSFEAPKQVLICVRRKRRKEVMHALKKTGKVGQRRPRRSYYSDIHC